MGRDGRNSEATPLTPTHGEIDRAPDRRVVIAVVGTAAVLLLGSLSVVRSADRNATGPSVVSSASTEYARPAISTEDRVDADPGDLGAGGTAPADRRRGDPSIAARELPCRMEQGSVLVDAFFDPGSTFMAPEPQPGALIPGSVSLFRSHDPDLAIFPVPGSDYLSLAWGGGSGGTRTVTGQLDPRTGSFRAAFSTLGCERAAEEIFVPSASSPDGRDHLWLELLDPEDYPRSTVLVDVDLGTGSMVWTGTCTDCNPGVVGLVEGALVVAVDAAPQAGCRCASGTWHVLSVEPGSHAVRPALRVDAVGDVSFGGAMFVAGDELLAQVDPLTGRVMRAWPSGAHGRFLDGEGGGVFATRGSLWVVERSRLLRRDPVTSVVLSEVAIGDLAETWLSDEGIWYQGVVGDGLRVEVGIVAVSSDDHRVVTRYTTFGTFSPGLGVNSSLPRIFPDATGFWYLEGIPTWMSTHGGLATSDAPVHLLHVDVPGELRRDAPVL